MHIIITVLVCTYHPIFSNAICYMTPRLSNIIVRLLHVVPYHITPYHITSCSRHSTAPSTSSTSSRQGGLSAAVAQSTSSSSTMSLSPASSLTMQSVIQSRVNPSPLTHRRERDSTSTSACRTSSASQQHDRRDYDIQNATQIAASYRRVVLTDDALNSHTVSNSRTSITTPVSSGTGPGNQGQGGAGGGGGGSYRGYGSSPVVQYPSGSGSGSGSSVGLKSTQTKEYPSTYDTPYSQERSPKAFKTYNVSPMIDANSPGDWHLPATVAAQW